MGLVDRTLESTPKKNMIMLENNKINVSTEDLKIKLFLKIKKIMKSLQKRSKRDD